MIFVYPLAGIKGCRRRYYKADKEMILEEYGSRKSFDRDVLSDIDIKLKTGSITVLIGPSGAGKSTLLAILGLILKYDSGTIKILGKSIENLSDNRLSDIRNRHIGFLFQSHYLMKSFSVMENIIMPAMIARLNRNDASKRAKKFLERLGLSDIGDRRVETLSGGESQRISLLRAMIMRPELILADEPTGNLDSLSCNQLLSLIKWANKAGETFLIATHDKNVASIADEVLTLKDGKLI